MQHRTHSNATQTATQTATNTAHHFTYRFGVFGFPYHHQQKTANILGEFIAHGTSTISARDPIMFAVYFTRSMQLNSNATRGALAFPYTRIIFRFFVIVGHTAWLSLAQSRFTLHALAHVPCGVIPRCTSQLWNSASSHNTFSRLNRTVSLFVFFFNASMPL